MRRGKPRLVDPEALPAESEPVPEPVAEPVAEPDVVSEADPEVAPVPEPATESVPDSIPDSVPESDMDTDADTGPAIAPAEESKPSTDDPNRYFNSAFCTERMCGLGRLCSWHYEYMTRVFSEGKEHAIEWNTSFWRPC